MVSNFVIGASMLLEAKSEFLRLGAVVLVLVGTANSTELIRALSPWRRGTEKPDAESRKETPIVASNLDVNHRSRKLLLRKAIERRALAESNLPESEIGSARDPLARQASLFYFGLLGGVVGGCVAVYGVFGHLYAATLTGSIVSAVGLVTLACALVSAEQSSEAA
jgi:hypothetical protein